MPSDVRHATDTDRERALDTISRAFFADPVWSWVFPGDSARRALYPDFWNFFLTTGLRNDAVQLVADGAAVTVWTPPGAPELDDDEEAALARFVRTWCGDRTDVVLEAITRIDRARPNDELHWYLGVVATHHLRAVDAQHLPAYLESRTRRTSSAIAGSASNRARRSRWPTTGRSSRPCGGRRADTDSRATNGWCAS